MNDECPGLHDFPLRLLGIVWLVCLEALPYLCYLVRTYDTQYEAELIDKKNTLNIKGCTCVSISRSWRINLSIIPFVMGTLNMIIVYSICLYDGWAIATLCIVIGLACAVFLFNGEGFETAHSLLALLLFATLLGLQLAANTVYYGWFTSDTYSTFGSVLTIINIMAFTLLICNALSWTFIGMSPEYSRLSTKRWPNWVAFMEHLFCILLSVFLMLIRGSYA